MVCAEKLKKLGVFSFHPLPKEGNEYREYRTIIHQTSQDHIQAGLNKTIRQ